MTYYAVIDDSINGKNESEKIIAYHESRRVVSQYYYSLAKRQKKYKLVKCKGKVIKRKPDYYDFYLVRFGRNYIQTKYYSFAKENLDILLSEYRFSIEILKRTFEVDDLENEEREILEKAILVMQKKMDEELDCITDPTELKYLDDMYNRYRNEIRYEQFELTDEDWYPFMDVTSDT